MSDRSTTAAPAVHVPRRRLRKSKFWSYLVLSIGALVVLVPLYLIGVDSLLEPGQLVTQPPSFFPTHPQWHDFWVALTTFHMDLYLRNSAIMTAVIVVFQLVTSVLAAYAFAFLRFPFRRTLFVLTLATLMIPFEVTVTANFHTVKELNWQGNFAGLCVPFLATGFGIFLLRQAFLLIPKELREAAEIDGYGPMRFLWRVALPLARPSIAALAVFSFLGAWNQYLWPDLLSQSNQSIRTAQIGLQSIAGTYTSAPAYVASAVMVLLPLIVLLIFFQKNLIRSLTAGAVK